MAHALCLKAKLMYYPAPKNAGTSMRECLFFLDNNRVYQPMIINGRKIELYMIYGQPERFNAAPSKPGFERMAIVRDPISRFLSAYANRILDQRWHDPRHASICKEIGLPPNPCLEQFVDHINQYRLIPAILHHTRPQCFFLGSSLSYYDQVFQVERLKDVIEYLQDRAGQDVSFPSMKTDGPKIAKDEISSQVKSRIFSLYQDDYRLLGGIYDCD